MWLFVEASVVSLLEVLEIPSYGCGISTLALRLVCDSPKPIMYAQKLTARTETRKGHHGPVWTSAFSPDGKLYATGSEDGTIKLWKATTESYGLWK